MDGPLHLVAFNLILAAAAICDLRTYKIPNGLPLALAAVGLAAALVSPQTGLLPGLASAALMGAAGCAAFSARLLGGGDVKLLAAAALSIPIQGLPAFAVLLGLAGGMQASACLLWLRLAPGRSGGGQPRRMPYGLSIALAGLSWSLLSWS